MKNLILSALLLTTVYTLQSCSASRTATGPSGTAAVGYGSASNISAGRNVDGPTGSGTTPGPETGNAASPAEGGKDSLSRKVDDAHNKVVQFIRQASLTSYTELESSKIAAGKAENNYVKAFAEMAVTNHTPADAELKALATAKNIPMDSTATNQDRDEKVKQLSAVKGEEFETIYIQMMTKDYEQAVQLYEEGEGSKDPEVKAYAKKYLPMLKLHLKSISKLTRN